MLDLFVGEAAILFVSSAFWKRLNVSCCKSWCLFVAGGVLFDVWLPLSVVTTANRNIFMASLYSHFPHIHRLWKHYCKWPLIFLSPACSDHSSCDNQGTWSVTCWDSTWFMDLHWDVIITSAKEAMFLSVMFLWTIFSEVWTSVHLWDEFDVCQERANLDEMRIWAGVMHHDTRSSS